MIPQNPTILSLFNGMGCIWLALDQLGITPAKRYVSEVDRFANLSNDHNYPGTIHLGDVRWVSRAVCWSDETFMFFLCSNYIREKTKNKWQKIRDEIRGGKIDMVVAGSPCQGFSMAGKGLNFNDPRSKLFFEFVRTLKEL